MISYKFLSMITVRIIDTDIKTMVLNISKWSQEIIKPNRQKTPFPDKWTNDQFSQLKTKMQSQNNMYSYKHKSIFILLSYVRKINASIYSCLRNATNSMIAFRPIPLNSLCNACVYRARYCYERVFCSEQQKYLPSSLRSHVAYFPAIPRALVHFHQRILMLIRIHAYVS